MSHIFLTCSDVFFYLSVLKVNNKILDTVVLEGSLLLQFPDDFSIAFSFFLASDFCLIPSVYVKWSTEVKNLQYILSDAYDTPQILLVSLKLRQKYLFLPIAEYIYVFPSLFSAGRGRRLEARGCVITQHFSLYNQTRVIHHSFTVIHHNVVTVSPK